jgi:hypothetical protein
LDKLQKIQSQTDTLNCNYDSKASLKENRPTKANLAPPPTPFLERALGDRSDPYKTQAMCVHDSGGSRNTGMLNGDRIWFEPGNLSKLLLL